MRVKKAAIINAGLWKKEDITECLNYSNQLDESSRQGYAKPAMPEKAKDLLKMIDVVKPGTSAMYGSDESRGAARNVAFGYCKRLAEGNIFATLSPDTSGTYVISINTNN